MIKLHLSSLSKSKIVICLATIGVPVVMASLGVRGAAAENSAVAEPQVLRVCADPDNLPFSKDSGPERGLYVELTELIGERLSSKVEYSWWLSFNQKRTLRNTLLAGNCDAYVALPSEPAYMGKRIIETSPFLTLGYAVVTRDAAIKSVGDLRDKRIGVQFGSTPQIYFAEKGNFQTTTEKNSEDLLADLDQKRIDAAFLWGPEAGYLNKTKYGGRFHIRPVEGEDMTGKVAIGVKAGRENLVLQLNKALDDLKPQIQKLAEKYAFPAGEALTLASADLPSALRSDHARNDLKHWPDQQAMVIKVADAIAATPDPSMPDAAHGQEIFNGHCSHCHSQDGHSPLAERDLRRLKSRYDDKWLEVAQQTILGGRIESGMPSWTGVLSDQEIASILKFLETQQN